MTKEYKKNMEKARKLKVLLVDDEQVTLFMYQKFLSSPHVEIDVSSSLVEALALLKLHGSYHMVFTDLRLSGSDKQEGLHLARYIKKNFPDTVIALVTGYGSQEQRETAIEAGVDYYIEKPVEMAVFRRILAEQERGISPNIP